MTPKGIITSCPKAELFTQRAAHKANVDYCLPDVRSTINAAPSNSRRLMKVSWCAHTKMARRTKLDSSI
jgi:hypothetical protein